MLHIDRTQMHRFQPEYSPSFSCFQSMVGNIFTASILPLDTAHISEKCQRQDGAGRLRHHAADRYGPVTVQLIKPRHGDSSLTLGLCVPPTQTAAEPSPGGTGTRREGALRTSGLLSLAPLPCPRADKAI